MYAILFPFHRPTIERLLFLDQPPKTFRPTKTPTSHRTNHTQMPNGDLLYGFADVQGVDSEGRFALSVGVVELADEHRIAIGRKRRSGQEAREPLNLAPVGGIMHAKQLLRSAGTA